MAKFSTRGVLLGVTLFILVVLTVLYFVPAARKVTLCKIPGLKDQGWMKCDDNGDGDGNGGDDVDNSCTPTEDQVVTGAVDYVLNDSNVCVANTCNVVSGYTLTPIDNLCVISDKWENCVQFLKQSDNIEKKCRSSNYRSNCATTCKIYKSTGELPSN